MDLFAQYVQRYWLQFFLGLIIVAVLIYLIITLAKSQKPQKEKQWRDMDNYYKDN